MAKIDEIKEILNTLRIAMSISFGILVVLVGSLVKRYDDFHVDIIFWTGVIFSFVILMVIVILVKKISINTKRIKDL
jgi:hypothetical protein